MKKFKKRVGMTLIETTIVMIVATAALAAGASMYSDYLNGLTNKSAAHQMKEVTDAFSRYMDDNHMTLRTRVPGVGSSATVSFSDLQSGGYLPAAFENRTPYNHEYVLTVRRPGAGNSLQGLVHTTYSDSRFALEPKHALEISRMVGVSGGYTSDIDPQEVISTYGNYNLDLATFNVNPGPGVLVSAIAVDHATQPGEKYLHRSETGDPDHNRMNTSIDMSDNNLNNAHTVRTRSVYASELIDTKHIRADLGDITEINAETITTSSATVTANQTIGGTLDVAGRITAGDHITLTRVVVENSTCGPGVVNGTVARDSAGLVLSCQGGIWKATAGTPPHMYAFFGAATCPDGWTMADGTNGTLDLRGEFIRGWDGGRGVDPGRLMGSSQGDAIRNITGHYGSGAWRDQGGSWGGSGGAIYHSYIPGNSPHAAGNYGTQIYFDASRVVPTAPENRPRNLALLACMKTP